MRRSLNELASCITGTVSAFKTRVLPRKEWVYDVKRFIVFLLVILSQFNVVGSQVVFGATKVPRTLETQVNEAELIFIGETESIDAEWVDGIEMKKIAVFVD